MIGRLTTLALAAGIAAGGVAGWLLWPKPPPADSPERSSAELMDALMWNREPVGGPFALIDHNGAPRTDADFRGKTLLIYFGFTFCSDICPTDLQSMAAAVDQLGPAGEAVQPLFVTVDPDKDTPEQLRGYVALFHPRLVGLTGDARAIRRLALAYKVYYAKPAGEATQVDHSGVVYLIDAAGRYAGFFPPGTPADRMVEVLRPMLAARQAGGTGH
jgi:cytochrome oxidase Cu insertion factor (SCO1/SenC/PrrC family)